MWEHFSCLTQKRQLLIFFFCSFVGQDARRIPAAGSSPLSAVRALNIYACSGKTHILLPKIPENTHIDLDQLMSVFSFAVNEWHKRRCFTSAGQKETGMFTFSSVLMICLSLSMTLYSCSGKPANNFHLCFCVCNSTQSFIDKEWYPCATPAALVVVYLPVCPALLSVGLCYTGLT